jgi:hypothetical protein
MKQLVNKHTIVKLIELEDNSVENIKKEINKHIDDLVNRVMGNPDNENFQISELSIKRLDDKLVLNDNFQYIPDLESYKKPKKEYSIEITANVIRNDLEQ